MDPVLSRRQSLGALAALAAAACAGREPDPLGPPTGEPAEPRQARARLGELARRYEALMKEHGEHEWGRYAGKLAEGPAAQTAMERLRADETLTFSEAKGLLATFSETLIPPREAALWRAGSLGLSLLGDPEAARLADELEATINGHRFELEGRAVTRGDMAKMRRSDDPAERRATRRLEHALHVKAAPIAKRLLLRRRALAQELGKSSFYDTLLALRGVGADAKAALAALERGTRRAQHELRMQLIHAAGDKPAAPWDLDFALDRLAPAPPDEQFPAKRAMDTAFGVYRALGIDLGKPKLDVTIRDFAFGGQTISVQIPNDVRLVVRPTPGLRFYATLLHELGHAYSSTRTRVETPLYAGYEWVPGLTEPAYAEGIAEVFSRLLDEPRVLREHLGLSGKDARQLVQSRRLELVARVRRTLAWVELERLAHENPDADLDAISLRLERRLGATTYPAYTQSYLLAAMVAVQVREALKARFDKAWLSPAAGAFVTDRFVADGGRWTLREKLVRVSGHPLDVGPLMRFLNA
jgi:hypothetical protein